VVTAFVPVLAAGDAVPRVQLVDQRARPFTLQGLAGETLVVAFVTTRCSDPNECPLVSAKFARIQRSIGSAPIHLVELSVDPAFDRAAVLARYARTFGADASRWTLATGAPADVRALDERLGANIGVTGPRGDVGHDEVLVFVDAQGRIVDRLPGVGWTPEEVVAHARVIAGLPASPFERLRLALTRGIDAICGGGVSGISLGGALVLFAVLCAALGLAFRRAFGYTYSGRTPAGMRPAPAPSSKSASIAAIPSVPRSRE
jgi:cytochrome oxidase Cu insertion factor (SCO1/SenC/PrrC family)